MIEEHCPVCGGIISEMILTCNPPIYKKTCENSGRSWQKSEKVKRTTFNPDDEGWEEVGRKR